MRQNGAELVVVDDPRCIALMERMQGGYAHGNLFEHDFLVCDRYQAAPEAVARVTTAAGKIIYQGEASTLGRVIEPQYVAMMNVMMQETLATGTARKADLPGWQAAGKTGTSQDFRDAWFIGYTSSLVTGVICGVRVETIEDPTMRAIRILDKLIDELAKGKKMEKILR